MLQCALNKPDENCKPFSWLLHYQFVESMRTNLCTRRPMLMLFQLAKRTNSHSLKSPSYTVAIPWLLAPFCIYYNPICNHKVTQHPQMPKLTGTYKTLYCSIFNSDIMSSTGSTN